MSKWEKVKIQEVFDYASRGKSPNYVENSSIKVINQACIYWDDVIFDNVKFQDESKVNEGRFLIHGDILVNSTGTGTLGRCNIFENTDSTSRYIADSHVTVMRPSKKISSSFFRYFMMAENTQMEINLRCVNGSTNQIELSKEKFLDFLIPLPPIEEQKKIAEILDKASNLISLRKKQIEKFDLLVKARFVEMFGDPVLNLMGWEKSELCNHISVVGGYAFKSDNFLESGIPVLRIGNINSGIFRNTNLVFWKKDDKLNRYLMYPNDLVISLTGTVGKDDYGNVCILGDEYDCYYLNQRNAKLDLGETIDKYYLAYTLKFPMIKAKFTGISRGVRQANISNSDILGLTIPIPPIPIQNQFADFVQKVEKQKAQLQQGLVKLELTYKALIQQYFN